MEYILLAHIYSHVWNFLSNKFAGPDFLNAKKKDFLVIQRVKVGEALAKVCRALGTLKLLL